MNYKYTISHYVINSEGQYVFQTIWSGKHLIPFLLKVLAVKLSRKFKYVNVSVDI